MTALRLLSLSLLTSFMFTANAHAGWILEEKASTLNFLSTKNESITEVHSFDNLIGKLDGEKLSITVPLSSVNTMIPVRNERLQALLFNVSEHQTARFSTIVPSKLMPADIGDEMVSAISGKLTISGIEQPVTFHVSIVRLSEDSLRVTTVKPSLLNAASFGLDGGVKALQEIASLRSISLSVPITFSVKFTEQD